MHQRIVEALLFAAREPVEEALLRAALPPMTDLTAILKQLQSDYRERGVNLVKVAGKWQFRTAADLAFLLRKAAVEEKKLSRAAIETLAIIAYHQPVTRAEIEDIRGVMVSKGTVDALMEVGWVKIRGRKKTPGRPVTYGTTDAFLVHFGLGSRGRSAGHGRTQGGGISRRAAARRFRSAATFGGARPRRGSAGRRGRGRTRPRHRRPGFRGIARPNARNSAPGQHRNFI